MRLPFLVWTAFVAFLSSGCAFFQGVTVDNVATSAQRPSNIALYVAVADSGEPIGDLEAKNFSVYENGQLLAANEIQRTLLPREEVTSDHVVLLVDISGKPSQAQRATFVKAIDGFVAKVREKLNVTVYAYDGSAKLRLVSEFPQGTRRASSCSRRASRLRANRCDSVHSSCSHAGPTSPGASRKSRCTPRSTAPSATWSASASGRTCRT
jgi:hypothetical protein